MTWEQFSEIFALLALQLRATDADEAMARAYFAALKDLEPELVALAATRMAQRGGAVDGDNRHWFPKTSEWRALAGTIEGERSVALQSVIRKLHLAGTVLCAACEDAGWISISAGSDARWKHCTCRNLRRLEVLGRRPMPQLPERLEA